MFIDTDGNPVVVLSAGVGVGSQLNFIVHREFAYEMSIGTWLLGKVLQQSCVVCNFCRAPVCVHCIICM